MPACAQPCQAVLVSRFGLRILQKLPLGIPTSEFPPRPYETRDKPPFSFPSEMSIQDDLAISFEISHEQQSFRLLELPPALLELITSPSPPRYSLMRFKPCPRELMNRRAYRSNLVIWATKIL